MEQSVPKRPHIKFRRRGITQKKAYNIQNTAKVWNQENLTAYTANNETCIDWIVGCSNKSMTGGHCEYIFSPANLWLNFFFLGGGEG